MSEQNPPSGDPQNPSGDPVDPVDPVDPYAQGGQTNPYQSNAPSYSGYQGQGYPQYGGGYGAPAPDHPQSTTVLVLGIVSLVVCQILGPFAWVMGNRVVREIDASRGQIGGRSTANAGRICGIVATVLMGLSIVVLIGIFAVAIGASTSGGLE